MMVRYTVSEFLSAKGSFSSIDSSNFCLNWFTQFMYYYTDPKFNIGSVIIIFLLSHLGARLSKIFMLSSQLSMKFQILIKTKMLKNKDLSCSKVPAYKCKTANKNIKGDPDQTPHNTVSVQALHRCLQNGLSKFE